MARCIQGIFLVVCALVAGCSKPPELKISWTEYKDPAGSFSVLMPATPEATKSTTENPYGQSELGTCKAQVGEASFFVDYEQYPAEYVQQQQAQLLQDAVRSNRRSGTLDMGSSAATVGTCPAMEYEVQVQGAQPPRVMKGRLVLAGNRLYDVVVEALPGTVAPTDIAKFLDSFKPSGS